MKKRVGRPARLPLPGERVGLSLRVTPATKMAMEAAAQSSGRSLSQEAEHRIEQSFREDRVMAALERIEAALGECPEEAPAAVGDPLAFEITEHVSLPVEAGRLFYSSTIYRADLQTQSAALVIKPPVGD